MISLQATTPGTDPLVAVKQVGEQNNKMSAVLLNILSHMKMVLLNDYSTSMSMSDAFSTGTQREAARLCCEALLPYAVFKFASDYGLFHIHFGGMRMDVKDEDELRVWREYQETVSRARLEHYTKVLDGVTTLLKPQCFRRFNVPEEEFSLDFYEGVHYRSVDLERLDGMIDAAVELEEEGSRATLAHELMLWRQTLLKDETHAYVPDSHPWARNTGVMVGINMDAFPPFQKSRLRTTSEEQSHISKIPQLIKAVPVLEIYLSNRAESIDPMHIVWTGEQVIVPDLNFLVRQENKLPECVQVLREAMHELATTSVRSLLTASDLRHDELMQLYGNSPHKIHAMLKNMTSKIAVMNQAHVSYNGVVSSIKSTLSMMITGELLHWAMAARSVLDLKAQGKQNKQIWMRDWQAYADHLGRANLLDDTGMLDESNAFAYYSAYMDSTLQLELSFQNNATVTPLVLCPCMLHAAPDSLRGSWTCSHTARWPCSAGNPSTGGCV
jgi:hypothetical protein